MVFSRACDMCRTIWDVTSVQAADSVLRLCQIRNPKDHCGPSGFYTKHQLHCTLAARKAEIVPAASKFRCKATTNT